MHRAPIRIEVNGQAATAGQLQHPALVNYGHFTAMQVRQGRTRGLELHLDRLTSATRELFQVAVDPDRIRGHLRHALTGTSDASVRIEIFQSRSGDEPSIMVVVRPPVEPPRMPQRLMSVPYQRPVPHIKHTGTFAQIHYGQLAEQDGFDDALLTGPGGVISEAAISNIALHDGTALVWPDGPILTGITMRLLEPRLTAAGLPTRRGQVRLTDLPSVTAALLSNSLGVAPVGRIDDTTLPADPGLMQTVTDVYQSIPWEPI